MRLVSLTVEGFRCIRKAHVDFEHGLNVLFGPNDLGKSTLADAVRAALLLTCSQQEHKKLIPWTEDVAPHVELVFEIGGTYYRVDKTYGTGARGKSTLARSKDGSDFAVISKQRQVDEELRKLLRWGVPPPGGKSKVKGMPETFLSMVLLPPQDRVADVLTKDLAGDPDESGKSRLEDALEALATDPMFKEILDKAQAKVDEAFTPKGMKKRGRTSPWTAAKERINKARDEVKRLQDEVSKAEGLTLEVRRLTGQVHDKSLEVKDLKQRFDQTEQKREGQYQLQQAQRRLGSIEEQFRRVADSEVKVQELQEQLATLCQTVDKHKARKSDLEKKLKTAEGNLVRLESADVTQARTLEKSKLQHQIAETNGKLQALAAKEQRARELQEEQTALDSLEKRVRENKAAIVRLDQDKVKAQGRVDAARELLQELGHLKALVRYRQAKAALDESIATQNSAVKLEEQAIELTGEADAIEAELAKAELPTPDALNQLRTLRRELQVAEARLSVGLSVTFRPKRPLEVTRQVDEGSATTETVTQALTTEAKQSVRLVIPDVGDVEATAGDPEHRQEAAELRKQWEETGKPALHAAGVDNLEELAEAMSAAEERRRQVESLRSTADSRQREARTLRQQTGDSEDLRRQMEQREAPLRDLDRIQLQKRLDELGADQLDSEEERVRRQIEDAGGELQEFKESLAGAMTAVANDEPMLESRRSRITERQTSLGGDPEAVLKEVATEKPRLERALEHARTRIKELDGQAETALQEAQESVDDLQGKVATVSKVLESDCQEQRTLEENLNREKTLLEEWQGQLKPEEREQWSERVAALSAELAEFPEDLEATDENVAELREELDSLQQEYEELERKLIGQKGALESSGGVVVKEEAERWDEALNLAENDQKELEVQFDAWKLLVDTLKDVERRESCHLGRAIVEPLSERFCELTGGLYGSLNVGPGLDTQGILAAGQERDVDSLSVGTKEQLATVFRICLAERLKTCVILDDQLTQSDDVRLAKLLDVLYQDAREFQIVVLTCHPEDYEHSELGAQVAKVDLGKQIARYGV
jgi:DNA repair exonuclease SbcCD ATPase subunit